MSPFQIRRERFSEFCLLIKRLNERADRIENTPKTKDGKQLNFIPVLDYDEEVAKNGG